MTGAINDFSDLLQVLSAKVDGGGPVLMAGRDVLCFLF